MVSDCITTKHITTLESTFAYWTFTVAETKNAEILKCWKKKSCTKMWIKNGGNLTIEGDYWKRKLQQQVLKFITYTSVPIGNCIISNERPPVQWLHLLTKYTALAPAWLNSFVSFCLWKTMHALTQQVMMGRSIPIVFSFLICSLDPHAPAQWWQVILFTTYVQGCSFLGSQNSQCPVTPMAMQGNLFCHHQIPG